MGTFMLPVCRKKISRDFGQRVLRFLKIMADAMGEHMGGFPGNGPCIGKEKAAVPGGVDGNVPHRAPAGQRAFLIRPEENGQKVSLGFYQVFSLCTTWEIQMDLQLDHEILSLVLSYTLVLHV